jgi:hypothetical protein
MFPNVSLTDTPLKLVVKKKKKKKKEKWLDPRVVNWKYHINIME